MHYKHFIALFISDASSKANFVIGRTLFPFFHFTTTFLTYSSELLINSVTRATRDLPRTNDTHRNLSDVNYSTIAYITSITESVKGNVNWIIKISITRLTTSWDQQI